MNIYFLVEGRQCERRLYPLWLSYAVPELVRVNNPAQATSNSYFLISGEGGSAWTSITGLHPRWRPWWGPGRSDA